MASKSHQAEMCTHLGRMITNKLYECLEEKTGCPYRIMFGNGHFCSCRLNCSSGDSDHKTTHNKEDAREKWDSKVLPPHYRR